MARHALSWMDDHLSFGEIDRLIGTMAHPQAAKLLAPAALPTADAYDNDTRHALQHHASDLLEGSHEDVSRALFEQLASAHGDLTVDTLSLAMLRACGLDAAVALTLAVAAALARPQTRADLERPHASFVITGGPARRQEARIAAVNGALRISAPIAAEARWVHDALVFERPLPETARIAMPGMKLARIVSHPLLDPLDLTVTAADIPIGEQVTRIATDLAPAMTPLSAIAFEETRPDRRTFAPREKPRPPRHDSTPSF